MARHVFFSFHYEPDNWRASQIRNIGAIEGNRLANDNHWEEIKRGGEKAIQNWIDENMKGKSCLIVLAGANSAGRKWIDYEIQKAWKDGKGVFGIHIHNLKDRQGNRAVKGNNPFAGFTLGEGTNAKAFDKIVKCYDPTYQKSNSVYQYIANNIVNWIEEAIEIRNNH